MATDLKTMEQAIAEQRLKREMGSGVVKRWIMDKGFGFITTDEDEEVYFHHTGVMAVGQGRVNIATNTRVEFRYAKHEGVSGKKRTVVDVKKVDGKPFIKKEVLEQKDNKRRERDVEEEEDVKLARMTKAFKAALEEHSVTQQRSAPIALPLAPPPQQQWHAQPPWGSQNMNHWHAQPPQAPAWPAGPGGDPSNPVMTLSAFKSMFLQGQSDTNMLECAVEPETGCPPLKDFATQTPMAGIGPQDLFARHDQHTKELHTLSEKFRARMELGLLTHKNLKSFTQSVGDVSGDRICWVHTWMGRTDLGPTSCSTPRTTDPLEAGATSPPPSRSTTPGNSAAADRQTPGWGETGRRARSARRHIPWPTLGYGPYGKGALA